MSFPLTTTGTGQNTHEAVTLAPGAQEKQLSRAQGCAEQDPQGC